VVRERWQKGQAIASPSHHSDVIYCATLLIVSFILLVSLCQCKLPAELLFSQSSPLVTSCKIRARVKTVETLEVSQRMISTLMRFLPRPETTILLSVGILHYRLWYPYKHIDT